MSERVFMSRTKDDGDALEVSLGGARILITELRIRPMSNWKTPHQILGRGGASIALTDRQLIEVVAEYLRYRLSDSVVHEQSQVTFKFSCRNEPHEGVSTADKVSEDRD